MRVALFLSALLLAGCSTISPAEHSARVSVLRAQTPYVSPIANSYSMLTVVDPGSARLVMQFPYDRLATGRVAVFWPIASPTPICHFVGRRIGTDSWETHGMNQDSDLTAQGFLLTRENYIGIMR